MVFPVPAGAAAEAVVPAVESVSPLYPEGETQVAGGGRLDARVVELVSSQGLADLVERVVPDRLQHRVAVPLRLGVEQERHRHRSL